MLVNISGKGTSGPIPGIGLLAPLKNYDAPEATVRRLLNYNQWKVYEASTGRLITSLNVTSIIEADKNASSSGGGSGGSGESSGGGTTVITETVNWKVLT